MNITSAHIDYSSFSQFQISQVIIQQYGCWVKKHIEDGWDGYCLSFSFKPVAGSVPNKAATMEKDVTNWYGRLLTRMFHNPNSPRWAGLLPWGLFAHDLPVMKSRRKATFSIRQLRVNDGLHMHGILLARRVGRIKTSLEFHFEEKGYQYQVGSIANFDIQRISTSPEHTQDHIEHATDYALKGLKRSSLRLELLVLPR